MWRHTREAIIGS